MQHWIEMNWLTGCEVYEFKVNNKDIKQKQWRHSSVLIVHCEWIQQNILLKNKKTKMKKQKHDEFLTKQQLF